MPNILIVEDDININNLLCEVLMKAGYTCEQAFSGTEAKLLLDIKEKAYTLVLLDLMLPGASGEEVLKEIRKHGRLPVIVLTAKDSIDDKIGVLTDGADDYITKPFEIREVLARIQVQLRHIEAETESEAKGETESETKVKTKAGMQEGQYSGRLEFRDMVLTRSTFEVSIGGRVLPKITKQEFAILELLLKNPKHRLPYLLRWRFLLRYRRSGFRSQPRRLQLHVLLSLRTPGNYSSHCHLFQNLQLRVQDFSHSP